MPSLPVTSEHHQPVHIERRCQICSNEAPMLCNSCESLWKSCGQSMRWARCDHATAAKDPREKEPDIPKLYSEPHVASLEAGYAVQCTAACYGPLAAQRMNDRFFSSACTSGRKICVLCKAPLKFADVCENNTDETFRKT